MFDFWVWSLIDFDFSQMIYRFNSWQNSLQTLSGAMELNGFTSDDWAIIQPLVSSLSRLSSPSCFWDRLCEKWWRVVAAWNWWGNMWTSWKSLLMILMSAIQFGVRCLVSVFCYVVIRRTVGNELIQMWLVWGEITLETIEFLVRAWEWCRVPYDTLKWYHESWVAFLLKKSNKAHVSLSRWFRPVGTHFHHDRGSVATSTKGKSLGGPATFWHVFFGGSVKLVKPWNWSN